MAKPRARTRRRTVRAGVQQRAIERLISELGHEINNPLFAARAGVSLLTTAGCNDATAEQLRAIEQDLARIAAAMRELRSRVERSLVRVSARSHLRDAQVDQQRDRTADES